ncbi:MAG: metallophosphoesterase [candidate division Zixibacteria bacterium]|nr:metallophosphoesterase [candidate division Zixibacteria bacterium]
MRSLLTKSLYSATLALAVLVLLVAGCRVSYLDDCVPPVSNLRPVMEAQPGAWFCYRATVPAKAGSTVRVDFERYPGWLTAKGDSLFGTVPADISDTSFTVIVSRNPMADTSQVRLLTNLPSVVVFGDTRSDHTTHRLIAGRIMEAEPVAIFHTGDLVEDGRKAELWAVFNEISAELLATGQFYPALGNHEWGSPLYFDNFELPNNEQWYTIDRLQTRFIVLNSCGETGVESEQYCWLEQELASVPDSIRFVVAVFHHPPYSTGDHGEDEKGLRDSFCRLFEKYGVDIVFNGHDHDYERSYCNGIYYVVSGGGGAPLYERTREDRRSLVWKQSYHFCRLSVIDDRMIVTVHDLDTKVIDRFELPG